MKYLITLTGLCLALGFVQLLRADDASAGVSDPGLRCEPAGTLPDTGSLRSITRRHSIDTATALLIDCLNSMPENRHTRSLFLSALSAAPGAGAARADFLAQRADAYTVLFVPGWGYLSNGEETGGNLRRPREIISAMGFEIHLVPLADYGSVEDNAATLAGALRRQLQGGKRVVLASASSGGPAVALALGERDIAEHPLLAGWINICGVLRGSPVVDHFLSGLGPLFLRAISLFQGWTYAELLSLSRSRSLSRFERFAAPPQLVILNYVGIPFSGQVSSRARTLYDLIADLGPNDGLTLIPDALAPGYTIMALGSDHFIAEDADIDRKTAALLPVILKLIEG
jgi:hypothetical protein